MSTGLLQGKRGLIMGLANDKSIAWGIAKACAEQGAELAFSYQGEALKKRVEPLAASIGMTEMVECDVARRSLARRAVRASARPSGARSISWSMPSAFPTRTNCAAAMSTPSRANFRMTMDISVYSFTAVCQRAAAMMPDGRQPADADLLRRRKGHAALQRHGPGQGRRWKPAVQVHRRGSGQGRHPRQRHLRRADQDAGRQRHRRFPLHHEVERAELARCAATSRRKRWARPRSICCPISGRAPRARTCMSMRAITSSA